MEQRGVWRGLTLLVTFLGGGLGGSVFLWYMSRPDPTVVAYSLTTTAVGVDPEARSAVPDLKIQIGQESIPALYIHRLAVTVPSGPYLERLDIAVTFSLSPYLLFQDTGLFADRKGSPALKFASAPRIFGVSYEAPSPLQSIACERIEKGLRCSLGPLSPTLRGSFRIIYAADRRVAPDISLVAKGVTLVKEEDLLARQNAQKNMLQTLIAGAAAAGSVVGAVTMSLLERRRSRRKPSPADAPQVGSA